jgi:DNA mismatch repair ATPase MutS
VSCDEEVTDKIGVAILMPEHPINDPKHWLNRAKEARALAEQIDDPETKRTMLKNAHDYERLAQRAGERAAGRWPQSK